MPITQAKLKSMLSYDPESGDFHWIRGAHPPLVGRKAGTKGRSNVHTYLLINIKGKAYRAHRLAWLYMTGKWPKNMLDHKDTDTFNNRWKNLREATASQNCANSRATKGRVLPKGVSFCKRNGKFLAQIKKGRKGYFLGHFSTPEAAHAAYIAAAVRLHGQFARAA